MLLNQINEIIEPRFHYEVSKYMLLDLDTISKQTIEHFFAIKIEPLENKRKQINEKLNMAVVQQRNLRLNDIPLQHAKDLANELISDLKIEYHL